MSRLRLILSIAALVMFGLCAVPAAAHTRSESHSDWQINGTHVETTVAIPELEVKRLGPPGAVITNADVARYMQGKVTVSAGGQACANPGGAKALASTSQFRRVQFEFDCQSAKAMKLGFSGFFELVPSHTDFAQISIAGGEFVEQLFVKDAQVVEAGAESSENALRNAGFLKYVSMGVMHIFTGVDHMSFLVGLVLLSKRTKDLLFVVTGFTIGHSITLALAVTGVIRPHADYIDALVALTICLIGAENLGVATKKPVFFALGLALIIVAMGVIKALGFGGLPIMLSTGAGLFTACYLMISGRLPDAGRLRMIITLVFGLIHGFGFAAGLLELQIPPGRLAEMLVGFNIGVEIGQLTLVLGVTLLVWGLTKIKWTVPRPIFVDFASAFLVAEGLFWYVSRSFV